MAAGTAAAGPARPNAAPPNAGVASSVDAAATVDSASLQAPNVPTLPCDAAAKATTPCQPRTASRVFCVTRLLTKSYTAPLFKLVRTSDNKALDVYPYNSKTVNGNKGASLIGSADVGSVNSFCKNTTCSVSYIYIRSISSRRSRAASAM